MSRPRKTKGTNKWSKVVVVFSLMILLFSIIPPPNKTSARELNSNDFRQVLIDIGRGKSVGDTDVLGQMTADQLKAIGIFMSNYYVPFSTQIGSKRNEEETEKIKTDMAKVLSEIASFPKELSDVIVEAVLSISDKPKQLYMGYSNDDGKTLKTAKTNGKSGRQATFYEFLDQISGYPYKHYENGNVSGKKTKDELNKEFSSADCKTLDGQHSIFNDENYGYSCNLKNKGYLYWGDGSSTSISKDRVVFDWNPNTAIKGGQTASQTVMSQIYNYLSLEDSVGGSFIDMTADERGKADSKVITKMFEKTGMVGKTNKELYAKSMYGWTMWVDAIGNILVDTGSRQYVVVPAAMNPYNFIKDGKDKSNKDFEVGRAVPLNNIMSIAMGNSMGLVNKKDPFTPYEGRLTVNNIEDTFPESRTLSKARAFSIFPGTDQINWYEGTWDDKIPVWNWIVDSTNWGSVTLESLTTQYGLEMYSLGGNLKRSGKDRWLKFGKKSGDTERYKSPVKDKDKSRFMFSGNYPTEQDWIRGVAAYTYVPHSGLNKTPHHFIIQDILAFDNMGLGEEAFKNSTDTLETMKKTTLWKENGTPIMEYGDIAETEFGKALDPERNAVTTTANKAMKDFSAHIYVTYILAALGGSEQAGFEISFSHMPVLDKDVVMGGIQDKVDSMADDKSTQELKNMAYYFLHPTEGIDYIKRWVKTKVGGSLVGWHSDMVGSVNTSSSTGLTKYIGFSNFTSMPSLNDMSWTTWMVGNYLEWGIYLVILVLAMVLIYIAIGDMTIQRGAVALVIFTACLYLPPIAINSVVGVTNTVSDKIYSDKFLYWGISQLQEQASKVDELAQAGADGREADYSRTLMQLQGDGMYANNSGMGNAVTLKWMAPKRDNYAQQVQDELNSVTGGNADNFSALTQGLIGNKLSGETYLDSNKALYLYRTLTDINNYSRFYYGNLMGESVYSNGSTNHTIGNPASSMSKMGLSKVYNNYLQGTDANSLTDRKKKGFINDRENAIKGTSSDKVRLKRLYAPISSAIVPRVLDKPIDNVKLGDNVGIPSDKFKTTIRNFNDHSGSISTQIGVNENNGDLTGLATFSIYTESPFYYFSWYLYDNGLKTGSGSSGTFNEMMLDSDKDFFYNYTGDVNSSSYGELKDYMDIGSLFHTIIPYLRKANEPVKDWGSKYGLDIYEDVSMSEDDSDRYKNTQKDIYHKYWHNTSIVKLMNVYTPWVDAMYDTDYAKPETISYAGKKQRVEDPINPSSYKIRPMVFSESEREYYGLKDSQLTAVEKKILKIQRDTRRDLLPLLNYSNFDDTVLNTMTAMVMTFNFNREFSQSSAIAESYTQYPQGFELKNFTYDAYLRLILRESTGEDITDIQNQGSVYDRVVEKSSILTGILLVTGDIVTVYLIPVLKFFFLITIFVLSVLAILVKSMRSEIRVADVLWKPLLAPLIMFCVTTVGHSLIISFFMSDGATQVTGSTRPTIPLGDPSMVLVAILVINLVALTIYGIISYGVVKHLITYTKLTTSILKGAATGIGTGATQMVNVVSSKVTGMNPNATGFTKTPSNNSTNMDERGRRNVDVDSTVKEDFRARNMNRAEYAKKSFKDNTPKVDVNEMIENGRRKSASQDWTDFVDSKDEGISIKHATSITGGRPKPVEPSTDIDKTVEKGKRKSKKNNESDKVDKESKNESTDKEPKDGQEQKKKADEIKDKYQD